MRGRPPGQPLTPQLIGMLRETVDAGEQAIVLYNRRGYAPVVECTGCGATYSCPSCGVGSLVLHQKQGRLSCHYCGFRRDYDRTCPSCGTQMSELGYGTERIEEALKEALPGTKIARMDADTTKGRGAHQRILSAFRDGESQVLVGTQLVAKGHDFPGVTLAAVVGVDHVLLMPDFRSAERTYGLVTQLAGRAGRGERPGRVILQTRQSDHFVFKHVSPETALDAFYEEEVHQRGPLSPAVRPRRAGSPGIRIDEHGSRRRECARPEAPKDRRWPIDSGLRPLLAPLSRLVGRWRFQVILRGRDVPRFRAWIDEVSPILLERAKKRCTRQHRRRSPEISSSVTRAAWRPYAMPMYRSRATRGHERHGVHR